MRCQRIPLEMAILAKMVEMAINRQIVNDISNKMAKGPVLKVAILAKMAETANNRQIVNNKIISIIKRWPTRPLLKVATLATIAEMANNRQIVNNISNEMAKGLI